MIAAASHQPKLLRENKSAALHHPWGVVLLLAALHLLGGVVLLLVALHQMGGVVLLLVSRSQTAILVTRNSALPKDGLGTNSLFFVMEVHRMFGPLIIDEPIFGREVNQSPRLSVQGLPSFTESSTHTESSYPHSLAPSALRIMSSVVPPLL